MEDENEKVRMVGRADDSQATPASRHPIACFFHCAFKGGAILSYLLLQLFNAGFVLNFIICVLLLSFDFWTVKNVTGRILVSLRWWNEIKEDGSNEWIFESAQDRRKPHPQDDRIFWLGLNIPPVIWLLFGIKSLIDLDPHWFLICAIGMALSGSNTYGYWKCRRDSGKQLKNINSMIKIASALR
eukprot:c14816_g1_i2.p1 GENE.c14816_g1_i2~~c14816_g1_i2.p1  ORF type:complete len:192 (+),score=47.93 c14816_g1_i2:24-578(+)